MTPPRSRARPAPPPRDPSQARENAAVTVLRILGRMVRNLFVYGRPFPPPFVFKKEPPA